ncbi:hypothetical protein ACA910_018285 [Epithemia clementina (nom. ined.)]
MAPRKGRQRGRPAGRKGDGKDDDIGFGFAVNDELVDGKVQAKKKTKRRKSADEGPPAPETTTPKQRRSSRTRRKTSRFVDEKGQDDEISINEDPAEDSKAGLDASQDSQRAGVVGDDGEKEGAEIALDEAKDEFFAVDDDDDKEENEEISLHEKSKSKGAKTKKTRKDSSDADESAKMDLACPHCSKIFQYSKGLSYHVDNYVCRQNDRPGGPKIKGKRKEAPKKEADDDGSDDGGENSPPRKKFNRLRGKLEHRTCQRCRRVFTSVLGLNYHLERRVCEKAGIKEVPFPTLEPGTLLVTRFGVVQVVRDDRATPTASFPENLKHLVRLYNGSRHKRELQVQKVRSHQQAMHLLQRKRLNKLYERGNISQETVFNTCSVFRVRDKIVATEVTSDPAAKRQTGIWPPRPDPSVPAESFPDRIVECIRVPDARKRYCGVDCTPMTAKTVTNPPMRLFLRRRILTEIYSENGELFVCPTCGYEFESRIGLTHHAKNDSCVRKAEELKTKNMERINAVDAKANRFLLKGVRKPPPQQQQQAPALFGTQGRVKSLSGAMPELQDSGAALPGAADEENVVVFRPAITQRQAKQVYKPDEKFVDPRILLENLKNELKLMQSQMIGPMYPVVFYALGFKKACIPPKKKKKPKQKIKKKTAKKKPIKTKPTVTTNTKLPPPEKQGKADLKTPPPQILPGGSRDNEAPVVSSMTPTNSSFPSSECFQSASKATTRPSVTGAVDELNNMITGLNSAPVKTLTSQHASEDFKSATEFQVISENAAQSNSSNDFSVAIPPRYPPRPDELPTIVDTRVLVAEVTHGRYPSIKPNVDSVTRTELCPLCKTGPSDISPLVLCCFCPNSFHFNCLLQRYTVKEPEPDDAIMCHACIGVVISRRVRAEKRRLEKLGFTDPAAVLERQHTVTLERKQLVEGKEYECVLEQGRQAADLVEMLREAKARFEQAIHIQKANDVRRAALRKLT